MQNTIQIDRIARESDKHKRGAGLLLSQKAVVISIRIDRQLNKIKILYVIGELKSGSERGYPFGPADSY